MHISIKYPKPSIAVIIPVYHDAHYLKSAILSVLNQTQSVNEIIVVNDCSPESELIESIVDDFNNINYIKNSANFGLASSRNIGAYASNCDIISFLDADDELHPQAIEARINNLKARSAITCQNIRYKTEIPDRYKIHYINPFQFVEISNPIIFLCRHLCTGAGLMIERDLFISIGGYNEYLKSCEDWDFWIRASEMKINIICLKKPLYFYRNNSNSLSSRYIWITHWEREAFTFFILRNKKIYSINTLAMIYLVYFIKHLLRCICHPSKLMYNEILNDISFFKRIVLA